MAALWTPPTAFTNFLILANFKTPTAAVPMVHEIEVMHHPSPLLARSPVNCKFTPYSSIKRAISAWSDLASISCGNFSTAVRRVTSEVGDRSKRAAATDWCVFWVFVWLANTGTGCTTVRSSSSVTKNNTTNFWTFMA